MDIKKTGELIKQLRIDKGFTQTTLAEKLNISNRTVSKWENGDGLPDISILPELASVLGITTDELLAGELIIDSEDKHIEQSYPVFKTCGPFSIKDQEEACKAAYKDYLPFALRLLMCAGLITAIIAVAKLTLKDNFNIGMSTLGILSIGLMIFSLFTVKIYARNKASQIKAANGGVLPDESFTLSDKVYITCGSQQYTFNLADITAFYENKDYFILRFHKNVYSSVNKAEFVIGTPEDFAAYLRSFVVNKKKPLYLRCIHIFFGVIFALLCIVFAGLISLPNSPEMSVEDITKLSSIEVYDEFYENTYSNNTPFADVSGFSDLNEKERCAVLVTEFYDEFENGGLCQYLCNSSGRYAYELENNLRQIGLSEIANEYSAIVKEYKIDLNDYKVSTDFYKELKKYDYDTIDNRLSSAINNSNVEEKIGEYIKNNPTDFATDK